MNENEISYDFFDEPAYRKYYLLKYNIYNVVAIMDHHDDK